MFDSVKAKKRYPSQSNRVAHKRRSASYGNVAVRAAILAFVCGIALCMILLCVFAFLLANTTLPLTLVRPMTCAAAAVSVAVSSLVFSKQMGQRFLLYGLACGLFYAGCQLIAVCLLHGVSFLQSGNYTLALVLVMSGLFGGAMAAAWTVR